MLNNEDAILSGLGLLCDAFLAEGRALEAADAATKVLIC